MNILQIYSKNKVKLYIGKIQEATKATLLHYFIGMDVLQLTVPNDSGFAYYSERNGWLVDDDDNPYIIKHIKQSEQDASVAITAYSPHFGFGRRITRPKQGDAILTVTGSADQIVKAFIQDAIPTSGNRALSITCLTGRTGTSITDQTRRKALGDEVVRVLTAGNLGEVFKWNNGNITFDTYPGSDKTASCIFAARLNNIENESYEVDATVEQTTPYVAGAGEDDAREVLVAGDDAIGWERCEVFIDARDVKAGDTATLTARAAQAIIGTSMTVSAAAKDGVNLQYNIDYFVGDTVTVQVEIRTYTTDSAGYPAPGITTIALQLRITQATINYEKDDMTVDITFGISADTNASSTETRVSQLEANSAKGDVTGPSGAIDSRIAVFDGVSGKIIKDGGKTINDIILADHPVGSIYISVNSTSPATLFGGVWARWANGRAIIGVYESDPDFASPDVGVGNKNITLNVSQLPPHRHPIHAAGSGAPAGYDDGFLRASVSTDDNFRTGSDIDAAAGTNGTHGYGSAAQAQQQINITPQGITAYCWKRTA